MRIARQLIGIFLLAMIVFGFSPFTTIFAFEILPSDPFFESQWSLYHGNKGKDDFSVDIGLKDIWNSISGKKEVVVAVIDTGVDIHHEDFNNIFWVNKNEIPSNGVDDDGNGYIDDIHGWNFYDNNNILYEGETDRHSTHITGIIAARNNTVGITGITSKVNIKIMVLKVLGGKSETGFTSAIADAIRYAEKMGASICNLSFGTPKSDRNLTDSIYHSKMLFVTAAGNGDKNGRGYNLRNRPIYPASYNFDNLITVANLQENGYLNPASNYGLPYVHIAAPGTKILSTIDWKSYKNGNFTYPYGYMSGTSMAVPMVTGVASILMAAYPDFSVREIREAILNSSKKTESLRGLVTSEGILDAQSAVWYCDSIILPRKEERKKRSENQGEGLDRTEQANHHPLILVKKNRRGKVSLVFHDEDKDIIAVRYARGKKPKSYFKKGKLGLKIPLFEKKIKGFALKKGKTYTIYVIDKKNNEAIKAIRLK